MSLEDQLASWTAPSSDSEQEKQDRTERMVLEAIADHAPFDECALRVYAKGSYANNTNVRTDSDVDIAVECTEAVYWEQSQPGVHGPVGTYQGIWTPQKLRDEITIALANKFERGVDASGSTAIRVHSSSARVDADVVPCFTYEYHFDRLNLLTGTKIFKRDNSALVNYPAQQLANGRSKNVRTKLAYKKLVRILKRIENALAAEGATPLPSYFMECLAYNCPDSVFAESSWTKSVREALVHIWNGLEGNEPAEEAARWREANGCVYLFHGAQSWGRVTGREFAQGAWSYLGLK
jgi:hypothetical protein